jgi:selenocysteine lyase/cysteine desulfurase
MIFIKHDKGGHNILLESRTKIQFSKEGKHGINPRRIKMRHFFDVASGIRGTDEAHNAASECYERIIPMLSTLEGTRKVAGEGLELAEETRNRIASLLDCEPRNIFFGNSATRTLIPIFLALARIGMHTFVTARQGYGTILGITENSERIITETATRQNFGELADSVALRNFNDLDGLGDYSKDFKLRLVIPNIYMPDDVEPRSYCLGDWKETPGPYLVYYQHVDRMSGKIESLEDVSLLRELVRKRNPNSIVIADATHSIGAIDFKAPDLGDVVIMNSSKSLGAEPTLGICYVSDRVLEILEENLPQTKWPVSAFQFSTETSLGNVSVVDSRYWISLPELFSLHETLNGLDIHERMKRFRVLQLHFNSVLRIFENHFNRIHALSSVAGFVPNIATFMIKQDIRELGWGEKLDGGKFKIRTPSEKIIANTLVHYMHPFVFTNEMPLYREIDHSFSGENTNPHIRISWSHIHTLEDSKKFCRRMAWILDKTFDTMTEKGALYKDPLEEMLERKKPNSSSTLETIENIFFGGRDAAVAAILSTDDTNVLRVVSTCHESGEMRQLAFSKLIKDSHSLAYIAKTSDYPDVAVPAVNALLSEGHDIWYLSEIDDNARCKKAQEKAGKKLDRLGETRHVLKHYLPMSYLLAFFDG